MSSIFMHVKIYQYGSVTALKYLWHGKSYDNFVYDEIRFVIVIQNF